MSKLIDYRQLQRQVVQQKALLDSFRNDPQLQKEVAFEERLNALLSEYGKSLQDVKTLLDTAAGRADPASVKGRPRARVVKTYRNPLTGKVVQTKGGNNLALRAWRAQFGFEEVESWVQF